MVLVFIEHDAGEPVEESLEAVTVARRVAETTGDSLAAIAIGEDGIESAEILGEFGVEHLYIITNDELLPYVPGGWAHALGEVVAESNPDAVIASGIERSQEVLARLGASLGEPMAANCNEISPGEPYEVIRQRWGGSLLEEAALDGNPPLLTVTPHETSAAPAADETSPSIDERSVDLSEADLRVSLTRVQEADIEGVPLGEARVVVGGGRGAGGPDGFQPLEELAGVLGGTVGSSRAAVNEGWRPHDDQIGLTGAKISPDLYIPCGISGAVQHWVGCKGADRILAINTDEEAAIIQKSDWAIIGDMHEVIPAIIEELESRGYD